MFSVLLVMMKSRRSEEVGAIVKDYPLEVHPNWTIASWDRYYVRAPIDRFACAFHLRTHITSLILAGNPAIQFIQALECEKLTRAAHFLSWMGLEEFFFSLIVSMIWLWDVELGRSLAALLSLGFLISSTIKVGLCLPRPPVPPAKAISDETKDWAWPSNHALLGTAFPWFIWIYVNSHHQLGVAQTIFLLAAVFTWNVGVIWARVYLGVHSPADVVAGWMIGGLLIFVFGGFAHRMHASYLMAVDVGDYTFPGYYAAIVFFCLLLHPRAWPETQSYGETVCVLSGAMCIWLGKFVGLSSGPAFQSLLEARPDVAYWVYPVRFITGVSAILVVRTVVKGAMRAAVKTVYTLAGMKWYSYSDQCKRLGNKLQPTKRFTQRMRFRPINGVKPIVDDAIPYDIDLPVKFVVYGAVGFMVGEACPLLFQALAI